ncbi:C-C motif chemokine 14-like [Cheilinus undulatus]|uniref:C-C motif chemokine 14-like n=1 Tax=Cheilinus undulatus TaxID=241271 RepID=UPI001BD25B03|nr:C-C motif chemokine 14-like [Cheilinus undulatus]
MMMKKQTIMLTCFLLLSALTVVEAMNYSPSECCFAYCPIPLPKRGVLAYKHTNKQCPKKGILFKMKNGKEYCADPSEQWVKNIIAERENI